jgi:hypothetical protein
MNSRVDHPSAGSSRAANLLSNQLPAEFYQNDWLCAQNEGDDADLDEEQTSKANPFFAEYAEMLMASKFTTRQAAEKRNRVIAREGEDFLEMVPLSYRA